MRLLARLAWPLLVGALGGLVALEGTLSRDIAGSPHAFARLETADHLWLLLGFLGPVLALLLERPALLRRVARAEAHPTLGQVIAVPVLSVLVGLVAATQGLSFLEQHKTIAPWGAASAPWMAFLSAFVGSGLLFAFTVAYLRLVKVYGWRILVALSASMSLYLALGTWLGLWPDPPGRL